MDKFIKQATFLSIMFFFVPFVSAQEKEYAFKPAANQSTPGKSHYYSWISHTNEGPSMDQILSEIEFFQWMKDEYGMQIDIFAIDAGLFDGRKFTSHFNDEWFRQKHPEGLDPMQRPLRKLGAGLGMWGGPDGFGNTGSEEKERVDMFLRLARDYDLALYKCDAVCGTLRPEKEDVFVDLWKRLREINPDLFFLNERLALGKGESVSTTHLFEGRETYIDVLMQNKVTAPHHRVEPLSRLNFPDHNRLLEDHGVCFSSCLDYWEDDLIIQAFGRNSVLSPQIYANPWLLRDDEFPKLARIFNLHRKYRDILVDGISLPEEKYGFQAVSRGDAQNRLLLLRNLSWTNEERSIQVGKEIGLPNGGAYEVRILLPTEKILATLKSGESVAVTVPPFRAILVGVFGKSPGYGIQGVDYQVVKDVDDDPVHIDLLALPGEKCIVSLVERGAFSEAKIDGVNAKSLIKGDKLTLQFSGVTLTKPFHRKLVTLDPSTIPEDARTLFEATCFAASNNALEVQSLKRSGETKVDAVKNARDEFFNQEVFVNRGVWDKFLFDEDEGTSFYPAQRRTWATSDQVAASINKGAFRLDVGEQMLLDSLVLRTDSYYGLQPCKADEGNDFYYSSDLTEWKEGVFVSNIKSKIIMPKNEKFRFIFIPVAPNKLAEVTGYVNGVKIERNNWKANNLFSDFSKMKFTKSWKGKTKLTELTKNSYLAVALNGVHGAEGAYVAIKVDGKYYGAYDRAPSFPANVWEGYVMSTDRNYTYYLPLLSEFEGKEAEIFVLGTDQCKALDIEVWQTAYPAPYQSKRLLLTRKETRSRKSAN